MRRCLVPAVLSSCSTGGSIDACFTSAYDVRMILRSPVRCQGRERRELVNAAAGNGTYTTYELDHISKKGDPI